LDQILGVALSTEPARDAVQPARVSREVRAELGLSRMVHERGSGSIEADGSEVTWMERAVASTFSPHRVESQPGGRLPSVDILPERSIVLTLAPAASSSAVRPRRRAPAAGPRWIATSLSRD
jgi:hypothetical protein